MAHTDKDQPWRIGGWKHRYWIHPEGHGAFTRQCRRTARAAARQALRNGREPEPKHPAEHAYWD